MVSNLRRMSSRPMPRTAPYRKMFSRPLRSGWSPLVTLSSAPIRPLTAHLPADWYVTWLRILSSVVLPEPLMPMSAMLSPGATSKLTSLSTQR